MIKIRVAGFFNTFLFDIIRHMCYNGITNCREVINYELYDKRKDYGKITGTL